MDIVNHGEQDFFPRGVWTGVSSSSCGQALYSGLSQAPSSSLAFGGPGWSFLLCAEIQRLN